ncbi:uncharacterized protein LOC131954011 [Physella acuta]|uniref:uncharacterized protein LOC131954011 n=1 Tax=Physella acuta TaxID=109671 RepID=UPI0027DE88B7|nr:uncharacterized protein LOC131954011 [Physella acuta]
MYPTSIQLNCVFVINSLCTSRKNLNQILSVDNSSVLDSVMRVLSDWTSLVTLSNRGQHGVSVIQIQNWCTLPRQNLILLCKLCVDEAGCKQMVKRGLVLKLKGIWYTCHAETDRALVIEALARMARFNRPADKLCYEGFLTCLVEGFCDEEHREHILEVVFNLGKKHLPQMLDAGLLQKVVFSFGEKTFDKKLVPAVLSILASFSANDQVRDLLLENEGQAYTLVLDTAFLTSDVSLLQSCISIISKMSTSVVSCQLLESNMLLLVAYIDKLLKTGPDSVLLHGLMQLQDYLQVPFLLKAFLEHHVQRVVEILCWPPHTASVQYLARQVLQLLTGVPGRHDRVTDQMVHDVTKQTSDDSKDDRIKEL